MYCSRIMYPYVKAIKASVITTDLAVIASAFVDRIPDINKSRAVVSYYRKHTPA